MAVIYFLLFFMMPQFSAALAAEPFVSAGRKSDPTAKTLSEMRQAEKRKIPFEVCLKASETYTAGDPVEVVVMVTNLFDAPLMLNRRLLVNHPRLQGEVSFRIMGPGNRIYELQRLITPLAVRDEDFAALPKGQSIQRSVDLADLYGMVDKGIYKIYVSYHNEVDHIAGGQRPWKGMVWSEPVEIRLN